MKSHLCIQALVFFCQLATAQQTTPVFNKTLLAKNANVEVYLSCRDTAGLDQGNWIQLVIKNKTDRPIFITDASYSIDEETVSSTGEQYRNSGKYGSANKYDLLHYYHDLVDASSDRTGAKVPPHSELVSWKYIVSYAGALLQAPGQPSEVCPLFKTNICYSLDKEHETLSNEGAGFCFFWRKTADIPVEKLAARLRDAMNDVHFRWVHSYLISTLMAYPDVKKRISDDDLVAAIIKKEHSMSRDENIGFLAELRARKAMPQPALTVKYREILKEPAYGSFPDLMYYWDDDLLDDLLDSKLTPWNVGRILEANTAFWWPEHSDKVYAYIKKQTGFREDTPPPADSLIEWSKTVKWMSQARNRKITDYLIPLLDNETAFKMPDWSRYSHAGYVRPGTKPDSITTRICDVAFVSLLRAAGQTEYVNDYRDFFLIFKADLIEEAGSERKWIYGHNRMDFDLVLSEKYIQLTPASKARIRKYLQKE